MQRVWAFILILVHALTTASGGWALCIHPTGAAEVSHATCAAHCDTAMEPEPIASEHPLSPQSDLTTPCEDLVLPAVAAALNGEAGEMPPLPAQAPVAPALQPRTAAAFASVVPAGPPPPDRFAISTTILLI